MNKIKSVVVFCGSNKGKDGVYVEDTISLGTELSKRNIEVIFGGGKVGLMGILADTVLKEGGKIIGVIPHFLKTKEVAHDGLTELIMEDNMHDRKRTMNELCDGVIALPGGFGTMEEFFEMLTWAQLGLHGKPLALLNTSGFYNGLEQLVDNMISQEFIKPENRELFYISDSIKDILNHMESYKAPAVPKWINKDLI